MTHEPIQRDPAGGTTVELAAGVAIDRSSLRFSFSRSGGPGGQAVNKLSTRAELRVAVAAIRGLRDDAAARLRRLAGQRLNKLDEIVLHADTHRSQRDNRDECLAKLLEMVSKAAIQPRKRKKVRPTRAMIQRRLDSKRQRSEKKSRRRRPED